MSQGTGMREGGLGRLRWRLIETEILVGIADMGVYLETWSSLNQDWPTFVSEAGIKHVILLAFDGPLRSGKRSQVEPWRMQQAPRAAYKRFCSESDFF